MSFLLNVLTKRMVLREYANHMDCSDHADLGNQSLNATHTSADDHIQLEYVYSRIVDLV